MCLCAAGLLAGVVILSVVLSLLFVSILILIVLLVFDVRRLPVAVGRLCLHKQSSVEPTYQEINVRIISACIKSLCNSGSDNTRHIGGATPKFLGGTNLHRPMHDRRSTSDLSRGGLTTLRPLYRLHTLHVRALP